MNQLVNRFATPFTTGLFIVSAVSGIALFFHWLPGAFHGMHEWLSMVLLVPFALHVARNWRALLGYARRHTLILPLVLSFAAAIAFAVPGLTGERGGNPAFRALPLLTDARLADLAPILKTSPESLVERLTAQGLTAVSPDATLATIASASGAPATEILVGLMPGAAPR